MDHRGGESCCRGCSHFDASGRYEPNCTPKSIKDLRDELLRVKDHIELLKAQCCAPCDQEEVFRGYGTCPVDYGDGASTVESSDDPAWETDSGVSSEHRGADSSGDESEYELRSRDSDSYSSTIGYAKMRSNMEELPSEQHWAQVLTQVDALWYSELDKSKYYTEIKSLQHVLPGASDLLRYMRLFGPSSRPIITIIEAYTGANPRVVSHRFNLRDPMSLAHHYDIVLNSDRRVQVYLAVEGITVHHVAVLGQWLSLNPEIFVRALWRDLLQDWSEELSYLTAPGSSPVASLPIRQQFSATSTNDTTEHFQTFPLGTDVLHRRPGASATYSGISSLTTFDSLALLNIDASMCDITETEESTSILKKAVESAIHAIGPGSWVSEPLFWKPHGASGDSRRASIDISANICMLCIRLWSDGKELYRTSAGLDLALQKNKSIGLILRTGSHWRGPHLLTDDSQLLFGHDPFAFNRFQHDRSAFRDVEQYLDVLVRLSGVEGLPFGVSLSLSLIEAMTVQAALSNILYLANHNLHVLRQKIKTSQQSPQSQPDLSLDTINSRHRAQCAILASLRLVTQKVDSELRLSAHLSAAMKSMTQTPGLQNSISEIETVLSELADALTAHREKNHRTLQIELLQAQITESRRAISQQDTVARLTTLAFIFIPTSCVTGIFSMQIVEWPTGSRLWVFGTTLAIVLSMSLLIAFSSTPSHMSRLARRRLSTQPLP